jgi:hypothetical protein
VAVIPSGRKIRDPANAARLWPLTRSTMSDARKKPVLL